MPKYQFKTDPFLHQREALTVSWWKEAFALLMEMGTGKSKVLIDNIGVLRDQGMIDGALIIAPKGVYMNWVDSEIPAHFSGDARVFAWVTGRKQSLPFVTFLNDPGFKLMVMNIEALSVASTGAAKMAETFLKEGRMLMALDESTTIKTHNSARTKAILKLGAYARFRRILTGLPVTQSPLDLYSQFAFLNPKILGHKSYFAFKNVYAITRPLRVGPRTIKTVVGFRRLEQMSKKIEPYSFRVTKDQCLDLPPKLYLKREIELTSAQREVYDPLRKMAMALISEAEQITAPLVITQLLRLHQVACGFMTLDDGGVRDLANNRLSELEAALEQTTGKVIIWATYQRNIEQIQSRLIELYGPDSVCTYYGEVGRELRRTAINLFQDSKSPVRFLIGTPSTGGLGITLTRAATVIYYSNNYSLEQRLQSEDRAHRIGQDKPVTYVDLITRGTVDEKIVQALRSKRDLSKQLLKDEVMAWL